ncbi:DHHA1 domain-containing protein [Candidatus Bathyarchaeota archaeon]|nr:DHHA1 domain-containing protein [Candidatus Bathyarchaeota archaeon]
MTVFSIIHGDDVDGITCGAFIKRVKGGEFYLANYDNLDNALEKVKPPMDTLYICDLNIRDSLEPELRRIREFATINIIDHHQMSPELIEKLTEIGVNIRLETTDCAAVLVYDTFKSKLGREGRRLAAYAAISDMFENGPLADPILSKMDRKFAQHEAQLLTHALSSDQSIEFKRRVMDELSQYKYPHRIEGVVEKAIQCLEEMTRIKETIPENSKIINRVAIMEATGDNSTGGISNLLIDTLGVDVGISYKVNEDYYNMSLRGEKDLAEHLGDISKELGNKYNGFGGGHQRASGIKVPKENLKRLLDELVARING